MRKLLSCLTVAAALSGAAHAETFTLNAAPDTVAWGNYDAGAKPVLHIKSGDTVVFRTLLTNSPKGLAKAGVADADIEQALKDVYDKVPLSAVREMIDFLVADKHMSRDDAYMLTSVAGDADITEIVDRNKGVHVMMAKGIFAK